MATLDGLLDSRDRKKRDYYALAQRWAGGQEKDAFPEIKVLRPAAVAEKDVYLAYTAIIPSAMGWQVASPKATGLQFEWYLVQKDILGTPIGITPAGTGPRVTITIPAEPSQYEIYLYAVKGKNVDVVHTSLNTPIVP